MGFEASQEGVGDAGDPIFGNPITLSQAGLKAFGGLSVQVLEGFQFMHVLTIRLSLGDVGCFESENTFGVPFTK